MKLVEWFGDMNFLWWYVVASSYDSRHEKWMSHSICWDFLHFSFLLQGLKKWEEAATNIKCVSFFSWTLSFGKKKMSPKSWEKFNRCKINMNHFIIPHNSWFFVHKNGHFYWFVSKNILAVKTTLLEVLLQFYSSKYYN